jgi:hypothetical protein
MTSDDKLKELFERELKQPLAETAAVRQNMRKNSLLAIPFLVMAVVMLFVPFLWLRITGSVVFLLIAIYQLAVSQHYYSKLVPFYRNTLVLKLVELVNPEYIYSTKEWFDVNLFNDSELYTRKATRCQDGIMIVGEVEKTPFYFAEVHAEYLQELEDGKETYASLFYGLLFVADFNKHLQGRTFVVPDKDLKENLLTSKEIKTHPHYGQLVKLENPEFERIFSVYGDSQQEARYVLTPAMMEAMTNIYKQYKRKMYFSFVGSHVYCAVSFMSGIALTRVFYPPGKKTTTNLDDLKEPYKLLELSELIIKEMNLNTRIWTKK